MKKFFSFLFLIFIFISSFLITPSRFVANAPETKPVMHWYCLKSEPCSQADSKCSGKGMPVHRAKLTTKDDNLPLRNKQTYVLVCVATELGNICTTGDSVLDKTIIGYDGVAILQKSTATGGFEFQGLFLSDGETPVAKDKIKTNSAGRLTIDNRVIEPLEWQDYTPITVGRKWLALNLVNPTEIPVGRGGQQQGTFSFEGALKDCAAIYWDPYGIVFDSQSLEPVPGVAVTLLRKEADNSYKKVTDVIALLNPLSTDEGGYFAFFVPDATYRLDVSYPNFTFPNDPAKLHPNFSKVYSDIYRGEDIIQRGKIEHRDIPIDAKGEPYRSQVKPLGYSAVLDKATNTYIIEGRVTHPLTKIQVFGSKPDETNIDNFVRTRLLITGKADKQGKFSIFYNVNNLQLGEIIREVEFIKTDLTTITEADVLGAVASSTVLRLNPILNYIEGYAYDNNGQIIPNATVGVYLTFSNKPTYETKADEKGYFKITSEYLPPFPYELRYNTPTGISYKVPTAKFLSQNIKFIEDKKTDLYTFRNLTGQVFPTKKEQPITQEEREDLISPTKIVSPVSQTTSRQNLLIIVVILLLLITITAVLLSFYYLKKKTTSFDNLNQ